MNINLRDTAGISIVSILMLSVAMAAAEDYPLPYPPQYGGGLHRAIAQEQLSRQPAGTYDYAYDPYTYSPRGYTRQSYSGLGADRHKYPNPRELAARTRLEVARPRQESVAPDGIFGYVEPEATRGAPTEQRDLEYGYYYDPETGELKHGWHHSRPQQLFRTPILTDTQRRQTPLAEPRTEVRSGLRVPRLVRFEGEVVEISTITGRTDNLMHLIVRIQQPDGTFETVGLGPFASTSVRKGDWIRGEGPEEMVRGRPTIMAQVVSVDGNWFTVRQHAPRQPRSYAGEIVSLRSFRPGIAREAQTVAEVHVGDGTVLSVLLGPTRELPISDLRVGDAVSFWARGGALDDLLVAEQIRIEDRNVNLGPDVDLDAPGLR